MSLQTSSQLGQASSNSIWKPLNPSKNEVRMLILLPAWNVDSEICCHLNTISLDSRHAYRALSYCWGDSIATRKIKVGDIEWQVTENLYDALQNFRSRCFPRLLYVDALCINQHDTAEKEIQIRLMPRIYQNAIEVVCWLGKSNVNTAAAIRLLHRIRREVVPYQYEQPGRFFSCDDLKLLKQFFASPYWNRTWVVQEILLARTANFYCGSHYISFADLHPSAISTTVYAVIKAQNLDTSLRKAYERDVNHKIVPFVPLVAIMSERVWDKIAAQQGLSFWVKVLGRSLLYVDLSPPKINLFMQVMQMSHRDTTLLHDKIYAYLGLLDPDLASRIRVAYDDSLSQVYREFAFQWMKFYTVKQVLRSACNKVDNDLNLPTWVPLIGGFWDENRFLTRGFQANNKVPANLQLTSEGHLGINAGFFDIIVEHMPAALLPPESATMSGGDFLYTMHLKKSPLLEALHHLKCRRRLGLQDVTDLRPYVGGGTLEDNYWRFMSGERTTRSEERPSDIWLRREHIGEILTWYLAAIQKFYMELATCGGDLETLLRTLVSNSTRYQNSASRAESPMSRVVSDYQECILDHRNRHFFITSKGYWGITSSDVAPLVGDSVYLIAGADLPYITRPSTNRGVDNNSPVFNLIGSAYVQGAMLRKPRPDQANDEVPLIDQETYIYPQLLLAESWDTIWLI